VGTHIRYGFALFCAHKSCRVVARGLALFLRGAWALTYAMGLRYFALIKVAELLRAVWLCFAAFVLNLCTISPYFIKFIYTPLCGGNNKL